MANKLSRMEFDPAALHIALQAECERRGVTVASVAKELGIDKASISRMQSRSHKAAHDVYATTALRLCAWLGADAMDFLLRRQ